MLVKFKGFLIHDEKSDIEIGDKFDATLKAIYFRGKPTLFLKLSSGKELRYTSIARLLREWEFGSH